MQTSALVPDPGQTTEQFEIVAAPPEHTVTVTELGAADFLEGIDDDHRATFVLVVGPSPGLVISLGGEMTIGRDTTAEIRIDDPAVSRSHARVTVRGGQYVLEDLGSVNGTIVNGTRVSRHSLVEGDRVQLGPRVVFRFTLLDEAEEKLQRQLFESATRDPLTGAYNKKYVTERLAAEVAHARRHRSPLEVVVFDLDRFKLINDHHGHLVGDAVLRAVADRVHSLVRTEDVFARFGGEEFVLLTRGCDAERLAERIRIGIEELAIPHRDGALQVTVSMGVARLDEVAFDTTGTGLVDLADQRLLRAKRSGRNQVCSTD